MAHPSCHDPNEASLILYRKILAPFNGTAYRKMSTANYSLEINMFCRIFKVHISGSNLPLNFHRIVEFPEGFWKALTVATPCIGYNYSACPR
jgi:hypothetical protein